MKATSISLVLVAAMVLVGLSGYGASVRGQAAEGDGPKVGSAKVESADREAIAAVKLAAELEGTLTIAIEGNPTPVTVVTDGRFIKRFFIGDKEFLMVASGNDKVLIRTQQIIWMRVSPKK